MTQQVQVFINPQIGEIKGFMRNGEPWFLAGDVCRNLGIKDSAKAVRDIEQKYKNAGIAHATSSRTSIDTKAGKRSTVIIPEPMLYELIFNSRKKKAIAFRAWVTGEVLPALRKHGEYRMKGKVIRKQETDGIKKLVEYAEKKGSKNADAYFIGVTRMTNKLLGIEAGSRNSLSSDKLKQLMVVESIVDLAIRDGIRAEMEYKEVYKLAKTRAALVIPALSLESL